MARWAIYLLGAERLHRPTREIMRVPDIVWPVIGCLLAAPGRGTSRSRLAAQLWPDQDEASARHCLASAFWRINKLDLARGCGPLRITSERVEIAADSGLWVDALAFERRAAAVLKDPGRLRMPGERLRIQRGLKLYRGDLLPERDQEWIAFERERLRAMHMDVLHELALAQANAGEWRQALATARRLCIAEPLREDTQRFVMEALARCGNRALALRQYREFEILLRRELGVPPQAETRALADRLERSEYHMPESRLALSHSDADDFRQVLVEVRQRIGDTLTAIDQRLMR